MKKDPFECGSLKNGGEYRIRTDHLFTASEAL